ncbi:hypothetical protein OXX69_005934 [Metschnikowia pulcherrima]
MERQTSSLPHSSQERDEEVGVTEGAWLSKPSEETSGAVETVFGVTTGTVGEGTSVEPAEETSTSLRETEDSTDSATSDTDNSETGVTEVSGPTGTGVVSPEVATLAGEAGTVSDAGVKCGCVVAATLSESTTALSAKDEEPKGV